MIFPRPLLTRLKRWLKRSPDDSVRILTVMPHDSNRTALRQISDRAHWQLYVADTFASALDMLRIEDFAVILCDRDLPHLDWRKAVATLATRAPRTAVILASSVIDDFLWQEVMQCGGQDVLTKPFQEERVVKTITFACSQTDLTRRKSGALRDHTLTNSV